tara:strand:- start:91 stop:504 length:414 start_codon:yes stop_codon:yes gene_type:complete
MYEYKHSLRVRYGETDQMGFVYYGNYAQFFEVGRVEALRNIGIVYSELEKQGIMLPVLDLSIKYHKPAHYDQLIEITVIINQLPGVKIKFEYIIKDESSNILVKGETNLVFVNKENGKPIRAPQWIVEKLSVYFNEK